MESRGELHDTLLQDYVGRGQLAPCAAQALAKAGVNDGAEKSGNKSLAKIGNFGRNKGNCRRDLAAHSRRTFALSQYLEPFQADIDIETRDGCNTKTVGVKMIFPYELFALLFNIDRSLFDLIYGTDEARVAYWQTLNAPWWNASHPLYHKVMSNPKKAVPLRTHGDDGAFKKGLVRLSMLIFTITGVCASKTVWSTASILLVFALKIERLLQNSLETLMRSVVWSLNVLADGQWPELDPSHNAWTHGCRRSQKSGDLADGYFGFCTEHLGDWKYIKEIFRLPQSYMNTSCCHFCHATKEIGIGNFADFTSAGLIWFEANCRSTVDYIMSCGADLPSLARTVGFHLTMLLVDFMHSDLQGFGAWILANALFQMAEEGMFGIFAGPRDTRFKHALAQAYKLFIDYCRVHAIEHSQKLFNLTLIGMGTSDQQWPEFKGKAHNCLSVLTWLSSFVQENPSTTRIGKVRDALLIAHNNYHDIMREAANVFTDRQAQAFYNAGLMALHCYSVLSSDAHNKLIARWQLKPKHHHLYHGFMFARLTLKNPRAHWLFKHEDFVGEMCRVGSQSHPSTISQNVLNIWSTNLAMRLDPAQNEQLVAPKRLGRFSRLVKRRRL